MDDFSRREFIGTIAVTSAASGVGTARAATQPDPEEAAIRNTAMDYIQGWYAGDPDRMERALHPELAKRMVARVPGQKDHLDQQSAMTLVLKTRAGIGRRDAKPRADFKLLDRFEGAAVARVDASEWIDYLHLAKWQGAWKIVNVLWEMRPGA